MNTTQTPSPAVPVRHRTADYYFDLPRELIAQDPLEDRSSSRLLVMDRNTGEVTHGTFRDILRYLHPGDALILNDTKVIPARLLGEREGTGASIEILLLKRMEKDVWECLVRPGKKLRPGARAVFGDGSLKAEILEVVEGGNRLVRFEFEGIFEEVLDRLGLFRKDGKTKEEMDRYSSGVYTALFRQAAEFGRQYGKELSPKQVKLLQAFVSLRKMNRAQKIFTILKYGFTFNRLHRTVGECMFL